MKTAKHHRLACLFSHTHRPDAPGFKTRRSNKTNLCAVIPVMFVACTALAQSWYTVDDFQYSPGKFAYATGLAKDPTGTIIYAAGSGQDASNVHHALVFETVNGGTTWSLMDDYTGAEDSLTAVGSYAGIASDPVGNLYVCAGDRVGGDFPWLVRALPAGGSSWVTVDLLTNATANAVATDSAGDIYVVGYSGSGSGSLWLVRKGTRSSGGISWAKVDAFGNPAGGCVANWVYCHPTAGVFVVGQGVGPGVKSGSTTVYPQVWTVRRSQDGGASWSTVDTFQIPAQKGKVTGASDAQGVGVDAAGNLYVVGSASSYVLGSGLSSSWIVRKSANPAAPAPSWSTVDTYQLSVGYNAWAQAFASDAAGNLFVAGRANAGTEWVVRESAGGTGTWNTVDAFQYGGAVEAWAALGDSLGNIFVAGAGIPAGGGAWHWVMRKN